LSGAGGDFGVACAAVAREVDQDELIDAWTIEVMSRT